MDFGPVVKPLGITVKKEAGKVVETSDVVRSPSHKEFRKWGKSPKGAQERAQKDFQNFETFKNLWCGASVDVGFIT